MPSEGLPQKEQTAEEIAPAILEALKDMLGGKIFTVENKKGEQIQVTTQPGRIVQDRQSPSFVWVHEPDITHGTIMAFSSLLNSPEAKKLLTTVMNNKNISLEMQEKVRREILDSLK